MTSEEITFPALHKRTVNACLYSSWQPHFKKHTPKATILALPDSFLEYLEADGVFIPRGSGHAHEEEGWSDEGDDDDGLQKNFAFPELDDKIREIIQAYGSVFPKFSWSSPQDAAWMNAGPPLKCTSPADVYLLLKASDFVSHDLSHAYEQCIDGKEGEKPERCDLVLKKWFDMPRSQEFRCFVSGNQLIAICQRDNNYYDFLQAQDLQATIRSSLVAFFYDNIRDDFPEENYTFDIYFTRDYTKIFIIDFNPFAPQTDSLLFDWQDLLSLSSTSSTGDPTSSEQLFRVIESPTEAAQCMPRFSHNRYPKDVVSLSDGKSVAEFAEDWQKSLREAAE